MKKLALPIILAAGLFISGCSTHPSYQIRGRPYLDDRYMKNTGKIR